MKFGKGSQRRCIGSLQLPFGRLYLNLAASQGMRLDSARELCVYAQCNLLGRFGKNEMDRRQGGTTHECCARRSCGTAQNQRYQVVAFADRRAKVMCIFGATVGTQCSARNIGGLGRCYASSQ